jgi:hypothetical protein
MDSVQPAQRDAIRRFAYSSASANDIFMVSSPAIAVSAKVGLDTLPLTDSPHEEVGIKVTGVNKNYGINSIHRWPKI